MTLYRNNTRSCAKKALITKTVEIALRHWTFKGEVQIRRSSIFEDSSKQTEESTELQNEFRRPMVITEVYLMDSYRLTFLTNRNNQIYTITTHVSY